MISIITPTYNHERFIDRCIQSVIDQTYADWEMIIVDDGSTDGTWDVIESWAQRDPRIRPYRQTNRGIWRLAETYNDALLRARGDLIAVLEGDDAWPPNKLEVQVPAHIASGCAISFGQGQYIDVSDNVIGDEGYPSIARLRALSGASPEALWLNYLRSNFSIFSPTVMLTRRDLVAVGGFCQPPYLPLLDFPTWVVVGGERGLHFVPEVVGYWRQSSGQTTWLLARDIVQGIQRYAREYLEFDHSPLAQLVPCDHDKFLSTDQARANLGEASYRASAIAFERGDLKSCLRYTVETARFGPRDWFPRCLAMIGYKTARASMRWLRDKPSTSPVMQAKEA